MDGRLLAKSREQAANVAIEPVIRRRLGESRVLFQGGRLSLLLVELVEFIRGLDDPALPASPEVGIQILLSPCAPVSRDDVPQLLETRSPRAGGRAERYRHAAVRVRFALADLLRLPELGFRGDEVGE